MKFASVTDVELVDSVKRREKDWSDALAEIMKRYKGMLYTYIYGFIRDTHTAEDVLQEVFIRLFNNADRFDSRRKLSTWLMRIAHNLSIDYLRRKRESATGGFSSVEPSVTNGGSGLSEDVADVLSRIEADSRSILILRDSLGFDYAEIADMLDMPLGTVKSKIFRARDKFKKVWLESASRRWA